jgi:hypothetical protein
MSWIYGIYLKTPVSLVIANKKRIHLNSLRGSQYVVEVSVGSVYDVGRGILPLALPPTHTGITEGGVSNDTEGGNFTRY